MGESNECEVSGGSAGESVSGGMCVSEDMSGDGAVRGGLQRGTRSEARTEWGNEVVKWSMMGGV